MVDGRVVAHGRDAKQVYDRARRVHPKGRIFLGQVPTRQAMILFLDSNAGSLAESYEGSGYPAREKVDSPLGFGVKIVEMDVRLG